ncbi:MAG: dotB [Gammaproteobacteria bacterium]|nr:dotB [Gammaproteobacteria bacterium]
MSDQFLLPDEPLRFSLADFDRLLLHCEMLHASDITLQTGQHVFAEVYGRLVQLTRRKLTNAEVSEILNSVYGANGTAQILSGHDVDTHYEFKPSRSERYRYRVNGTGCMVEGFDGIQITLRSIPTTPPPIDSLELPKELIDACEPPQGVVYVTGATGSGKSTLLASIIRDLVEKEDSNRKVLTYEAPIEFVYDEIPMKSAVVSQSEIPRHLPSFDAGVRNALRRKPRAILVGESRDKETISAVIEAAVTGHPVYTTLHTNGVAETIRRLVMTFPIEERAGRTIDIIETIRVVIWQTLIPSLDGKRVALREYLIFDEKVRDALLDTPTEMVTAKTRQLLKEYGQTMDIDAKAKFEAGIIGEREYQYILKTSRGLERDAQNKLAVNL